MTDQQLLSEYSRNRSEDAFAELVRRHVDHVYSAAVRMTRDPHLAQDVTQAVFVSLAQGARRASTCVALSAWLHRTARNLSANIVRAAVRRRRREQEALTMDQPASNESNADWESAAPEIDAALGALRQADRDALMLRYFEQKTAREIGSIFSVSEVAAQKRVARALDRLREALSARGVTIGAAGLAAALSTNAIQAAPAGLALTVSAGAKAASAAATAVALTGKIVSMTTLQKAAVGTVLAAAVGTGVFEVQRTSSLKSQLQAFRDQQAEIEAKLHAMTEERDTAVNRSLALSEEIARLEQTGAEAVRLRQELARRESELAQATRSGRSSGSPDLQNDPFTQSVLALATRAGQLNHQLQQRPDKSIPELVLLAENDWLKAAEDADLSSEMGVRIALSKLRSLAKSRFGMMAATAIDKFIAANNGQLPEDPAQLQPFFTDPIDPSILQRYKMLYTGPTNSLPEGTVWVLSERAPVDRDHDSHLNVGLGGRSGTHGTGRNSMPDPDPAWARNGD